MTLRSRLTLAGTGVAASFLVLLGGLVVSPMPESSWASGLPLRDSTEGRMTGLVVVVAGLGVLTSSWVRLWQATVRGLTGLAEVRRLTFLWCLPLTPAPPLFSRDGWSYAAQAELTARGLSPYEFGPGVLRGQIVEAVDPRWMDTVAPYGPLPLLGGGAAAELLDEPWLLVLAHRGLALVGLVLLAWALPRLAGWSRLDPAVVSALALPSPLVLAHGVGGLHNDLLLAGLAAAALVAARQWGWAAGGVLVGLAAAVKVTGGLAGLGVVLLTLPVGAWWTARVRHACRVGAVAVATLLAVGVAAGTGNGWVSALQVPTSISTPLSVTSSLGHVLPFARTIGMVLAGAALLVIAARWPTGTPEGALRATAAALCVVVVLGPVVHAWYALWCLPLVAACRTDRRGLAALLWFSGALGLIAPLDSSLEGRPVAIGMASVMVLGLVAAMSWAVRPSAHPARPAAPGGRLH